jgi:hypothetical protein
LGYLKKSGEKLPVAFSQNKKFYGIILVKILEKSPWHISLV